MEENEKNNGKMQEAVEKAGGFFKKHKKKIIIGGVVVTSVVVLVILIKKFGPGILDKLAAGGAEVAEVATAAETAAIDAGGEAIVDTIVDAAALAA